MMKDHELKSRVMIEVGFESDGLFLMAPMAKQPPEGNWPWYQVYGQLRIFKPARRQVKAGLQEGRIPPAGLEDRSFPDAGGLNAFESEHSAAPVIVGEPHVPDAQHQHSNEKACQPVNQHQSPHKSLYADGTSGPLNSARDLGRSFSQLFLTSQSGRAPGLE